MNENQFNSATGSQQNQPLKDKLTNDQTEAGNFREDYQENKAGNTPDEFPERNHQHDYIIPEANLDGEISESEEHDDDLDEDDLSDGELSDKSDDADESDVSEFIDPDDELSHNLDRDNV